MNPVFSDVFTEMAVLLLVASVIGAIGMRLRQPLIVAFIAVGILFGIGRFGQGIAQTLRQRGYRVLGVDFDPDLVRRHEGEGYSVRYGDAEDPEFLASLPLEQVQWVLSSVPDKQVNLALLHGLHEQDYKGRVTVTAHSARDAEHLKDAGADRVLIPYADAATEAVDSLFGVNDRQPSEVSNKSHTHPVEF